MRKIRINVNILDVKEVFENLKSSAGFPEGPDVDIDVVLDDISQNYEYLCKSPLIKSWKFLEADTAYEEIRKDFEAAEINMKDMRTVIKAAKSYFSGSREKKEPVTTEELIKGIGENECEEIYEEEMIKNTLEAISKTNDPLLDFLKRLDKGTDILFKEETTFQEYYKALYGTEE